MWFFLWYNYNLILSRDLLDGETLGFRWQLMIYLLQVTEGFIFKLFLLWKSILLINILIPRADLLVGKRNSLDKMIFDFKTLERHWFFFVSICCFLIIEISMLIWCSVYRMIVLIANNHISNYCKKWNVNEMIQLNWSCMCLDLHWYMVIIYR